MLAFALISFIPMLILALVIIGKGGADGITFSMFDPSETSLLGITGGGVLGGVLLGILLFVGFEAAASLGEEAHDPHHSIPRAVLWTVGAAGAFFVLMAFAFSIGYGKEAVSEGAWAFSPGPVSEMATEYVGSWFATLLELVVILDAMALALAICVLIGRGFFALGRDGLVPSAFAKVSRYDTPWVGNLVVAFGGLGLIVLVWLTDYASRFTIETPDGVVPLFPNDQFATFILSATIGSFAVELVYLILAVFAFRLVAAGREPLVAVRDRRGRRRDADPRVLRRAQPRPARTVELQLGGRVLDAGADRRGTRLVRDPARDASRQGRRSRGPRRRAPRSAAARREARLRSSLVTETVDWYDVGPADDLPDGALRQVEAGGRAVCVARLDEEWIAFDDTCTHEECSLAGGELDGMVVVCPCHGSEFDVRTGDVLTPPALEPLPIYEARAEEGTLRVRLSPPPAAVAAAHARDDHVSVAEAGAATVSGPSLAGVRLDEVDLNDLDIWERGVPYAWLALLRRDAPVFWQPEVEGRGYWAITRYDDVVSVSKDWETFSNELGGTSLQDLTEAELEARKSMLDTDPPPHTRMRAIVNKGFTPRVINAYEERIRELARGILEAAFAQEEFDWVDDVAAEIPMWVFSEIMGLPVDDRKLIIELGDKILGNTDPDVVGEEFVVERALRDPEAQDAPVLEPVLARPDRVRPRARRGAPARAA